MAIARCPSARFRLRVVEPLQGRYHIAIQITCGGRIGHARPGSRGNWNGQSTKEKKGDDW